MIQRIQSNIIEYPTSVLLTSFYRFFAVSTASYSSVVSRSAHEVQDSPILMALTIIGALHVTAIATYKTDCCKKNYHFITGRFPFCLPAVALLWLMFREASPISPAGPGVMDTLGMYLPALSISNYPSIGTSMLH